MRHLTLTLIAIVGLVSHLFAQKPEPLPAGAPAWLNDLDVELAPYCRKDSPGMVVIVTRGRSVELMRPYGMANIEYGVPMTADSVFDLASLSKQFAGYLLAKHELKGDLKRNDFLRDHLPWVPDCMKDVRIRHLIHHESGVRDWPGALALAGMRMDDVISRERIENFIRNQSALNFAPGADHLYSNTNYNLLAFVIEKLEGRSYAEALERAVFRPFRMKSSFSRRTPRQAARGGATSYTDGLSTAREASDWQPCHNGLVAPGSSSVHASARDLAEWMMRLQNPDRPHKAIVERMEQRSGRDHGYAYGQTHGKIAGRDSLEHTGGWAGFRTILIRVPEAGVAVALLMNGDSLIDLEDLAKRLAECVITPGKRLAGYRRGAGGRFGRQPSWPDLEELSGIYLSDEFRTTVILRQGSGKDEFVLERPDGETVPLRPRRKGGLRGISWWCQSLEFDRDAQGKLTGLRVGQERNRNLRFRRLGPLPEALKPGKSPR